MGPGLGDAKRQMREQAKRLRDSLPADQRRPLPVLDGVMPGKVVAGYWPIGSELDPRPLMHALQAQGALLALPVMVGAKQPLIFKAYQPGDTLEPRIWGIHEPLATAPDVTPDILLVPLLAFDAEGWRLGYGGGFYDRTLFELRRQCQVLAIGLGFAQQQVDAVPHAAYDMALDSVLTPDGLVTPLNGMAAGSRSRS